MAITVGARELKNRLGKYLRMVREGTVIIVADRGRPIAELRRIGPPEDQLDERLRYLAAQGLVSLRSGRGLEPLRRVEVKGAPASETIRRERADRL
jgi:antitoxin (DNA-binding transcriptional repressor) of toxin-antitoxin stability system